VSSKIKAGHVKNLEKINVNDFAKGVYFLNLQNGMIIKFIKQ
jgi:hypothetical protein